MLGFFCTSILEQARTEVFGHFLTEETSCRIATIRCNYYRLNALSHNRSRWWAEKKKKKVLAEWDRREGEAKSCTDFLSDEEKLPTSGKNWVAVLVASAATLSSSVVFKRLRSTRQLRPGLKKVDETNRNWQERLQLGAWQHIRTYYCVVFFFMLWMCCNESSAGKRDPLVSAAHAR